MQIVWEKNNRVKSLVLEGKINAHDVIDKTSTGNFPANAVIDSPFGIKNVDGVNDDTIVLLHKFLFLNAMIPLVVAEEEESPSPRAYLDVVGTFNSLG